MCARHVTLVTARLLCRQEPYCGGAEVSELNASDSESDDDEDDEPHYDQPDDSSEEEPCEKPTTRVRTSPLLLNPSLPTMFLPWETKVASQSNFSHSATLLHVKNANFRH